MVSHSSLMSLLHGPTLLYLTFLYTSGLSRVRFSIRTSVCSRFPNKPAPHVTSNCFPTTMKLFNAPGLLSTTFCSVDRVNPPAGYDRFGNHIGAQPIKPALGSVMPPPTTKIVRRRTGYQLFASEVLHPSLGGCGSSDTKAVLKTELT